MRRVLAVGLASTTIATALLVLWLGRDALVPALVFGCLATVIQLAAHRLGTIDRPSGRAVFGTGWLYGMGLRFLGVVLVGVAVVVARETFAPIPTAFGFLGALMPLLILELRTAR